MSDHVRGRVRQTPERQEDRVRFQRGRKHLEIPSGEKKGKRFGRQGVATGGVRRARVGHPGLDRLLHHCHVVHVDGSSYRLWEMERRTRPVAKEG
ncbi:ATP-binding protein [Aminiphilus sp.]|uniref:ATP-binding protein n=1 Tax=Aminiphilus sp. TaxID=1872488 RepID=UPI003415782F